MDEVTIPTASGEKANGEEQPSLIPSYPFYLPNLDPTEKLDPPQPFEYTDPGTRANPKKPHILNENTTVEHISPYIGTEIKGLQISSLTSEGLDELGLYLAERKVVIFRDQDFKDISPERQIEIARHFGPLTRSPLAANVKGHPEFHVVYRNSSTQSIYRQKNVLTHTNWHVDGTFEKQPPGITFFWILDQPPLGGDTLFLSLVEAYNRLSPAFQKIIEGLRAVHGAIPVTGASPGRPTRMPLIESEHPLVRVHPVTGEKALFFNPNVNKTIVGFKPEESALLLNFLSDHISKCSDIQMRAQYKPGTVVLFDNRVAAHTVVVDYLDGTFIRHAVRLSSHSEVPIPVSS